jgi:NhaA family Na+:H+ antiporter
VAKHILKRFKTLFYPTYIIIGILIFWLLYHAQLHTTLAGVIMAAITPDSKDLNSSKLNNIEHLLFKPVNYLIVPIFAIFNTAIVVDTEIINAFNLNLFLGIFIGLVIGKPIGITIFSYIACKLKIAELPTGSKISELFLVSILGGIGFTMSIFISLLAFNETFLIEQAKVAVLLASFIACLIGYVSLKMVFKPIST